ncbi:hypothetical protein HID58_038487 [Brassica napus]|uniref:Uncharacterized protein n=1 Tax=Brassica napus TaxID=3708 RepID=A0ABQ8BP95_BRANA|nr:hypothetical protein HID58_038487 [Brassica napus]
MVYPHVEKETEQVIQATKDNNYHQSSKYSPLRGPDHMEKVRSSKNFKQRVDRHSRFFGERLSTIYTCNPRLKYARMEDEDKLWHKPIARRLRVLASETRGQVEEYVESMLAITNPTGLVTHQITQHNQTPQHQTRDQVMEDLSDVTLQYLSCADPTEAKARQCRVLEGDAQGQMEEVAAGILAANTFAPLAPDTSLGVETVDQRITSPLLSNGFKPSGEPPANQNEDEMEQRGVSDSDVPPRRRR